MAKQSISTHNRYCPDIKLDEYRFITVVWYYVQGASVSDTEVEIRAGQSGHMKCPSRHVIQMIHEAIGDHLFYTECEPYWREVFEPVRRAHHELESHKYLAFLDDIAKWFVERALSEVPVENFRALKGIELHGDRDDRWVVDIRHLYNRRRGVKVSFRRLLALAGIRASLSHSYNLDMNDSSLKRKIFEYVLRSLLAKQLGL